MYMDLYGFVLICICYKLLHVYICFVSFCGSIWAPWAQDPGTRSDGRTVARFFVFVRLQAHPCTDHLARCNADHVDVRRLCRPPPAQGTDVATWCTEGADPSRHSRVEGHTLFGRRPPADQSNQGDFSSYLERYLVLGVPAATQGDTWDPVW